MHHQQDYGQLTRNATGGTVLDPSAMPISQDCCYTTENWHYSSGVTPMKQIEGKFLVI